MGPRPSLGPIPRCSTPPILCPPSFCLLPLLAYPLPPPLPPSVHLRTLGASQHTLPLSAPLPPRIPSAPLRPLSALPCLPVRPPPAPARRLGTGQHQHEDEGERQRGPKGPSIGSEEAAHLQHGGGGRELRGKQHRPAGAHKLRYIHPRAPPPLHSVGVCTYYAMGTQASQRQGSSGSLCGLCLAQASADGLGGPPGQRQGWRTSKPPPLPPRFPEPPSSFSCPSPLPLLQAPPLIPAPLPLPPVLR